MSIVRVICSSIQGEGMLAGVPATFVFSHDSDPRVTWCDLLRDPWAPEVDSTLGDLLVNIRRRGNNHVVIAGVEERHVEELAPLCTGLREHEYHTTVEVSGATLVEVDCDLMNVNIVLRNPSVPRKGKAGAPYDVDAVRAIVASMPYRLKFELADRAELEEAHNLVMEVGAARDQVLLQPALVAAKEHKAMMEWLMEASRFFGYRIGQRMPMPPPEPKPKK
ncbi:MAG: hypothetical protein HY820_34630 [Acidobacteria bacterium]|nr:hypothetical protein [Acidobacteriota bacterium]